MIEDLVEDLKSDEGWVSHAYQDHLGYWTIGWGFLIDERRGGRIPEPVADFWLNFEVNHRWQELCLEAPFLLDAPEHVQRALGNMAYQLGVGGVMRFRRMMRALEDEDYDEAALEALDSRWADQTPNRAERVAALIRGEEI